MTCDEVISSASITLPFTSIREHSTLLPGQLLVNSKVLVANDEILIQLTGCNDITEVMDTIADGLLQPLLSEMMTK